MKRSQILVLLLLISINSIAQPNPQKSYRTIEVIGYAYEEVMPNAVFASFVLKEYKNEQGEIISIAETEKKISEIIVKMNCHQNSLSIGNVYGYIGQDDKNSEEIFKHKIQYILKLESLSCLHVFLDKVDKKALESFNIDGLNYENADSLKRRIQFRAAKIAKEKAEKLLTAYGETCGEVIDVQEVNGRLITPDVNGKGSISQVINYNDGINYSMNQANVTNLIRIDYTLRATFKINPKQ